MVSKCHNNGLAKVAVNNLRGMGRWHHLHKQNKNKGVFMKRTFTALAFSTVLFFSPMIHAAQNLNAFDVEWMKQMAEGDLLEIELGTLAKKKCVGPNGQMFGEILVHHHTKHLNKLKTIAASKNVDLPTSPNPTQVLITRYFVTSKSPDWCYDFANWQIEDHKNAIALTEDETFLGEDVDVVDFAHKTLPVLKKHLDMATDLASQEL